MKRFVRLWLVGESMNRGSVDWMMEMPLMRKTSPFEIVGNKTLDRISMYPYSNHLSTGPPDFPGKKG